jgi:hypothetical protein
VLKGQYYERHTGYSTKSPLHARSTSSWDSDSRQYCLAPDVAIVPANWVRMLGFQLQSVDKAVARNVATAAGSAPSSSRGPA